MKQKGGRSAAGGSSGGDSRGLAAAAAAVLMRHRTNAERLQATGRPTAVARSGVGATAGAARFPAHPLILGLLCNLEEQRRGDLARPAAAGLLCLGVHSNSNPNAFQADIADVKKQLRRLAGSTATASTATAALTLRRPHARSQPAVCPFQSCFSSDGR